MSEELEALVLADAIGALDESERLELRAQLDALTPADREIVARLYDTTLHVAAAVEPHDPPAQVRERVLAATRDPAHYTIRATESWDASGIPGISAKILAVDRARGLVTLLLQGEPGARYPAHTHSGPEECYVLRGSISIGGLMLRQGDFHHADTDSDHDEIVALESAEVLLIGAIADYLPG